MTGDPNLDPYRDAVARRGAGDFHVTLWSSEYSQQLRFDIFTQICPLAGTRILDAGCSRGDFAAYLIERQIEFEHYVGIDALEDVIQHTRQRNLPRCEFHCGNFVTDPAQLAIGDPEVICISGALNTMRTRELIRVLDAAWASTSQSLLFNFLSDRCKNRAGRNQYPARRHNTIKLLDWALRQTTAVRFRQDYFPAGHDATILMSREQSAVSKIKLD